MNLLKNKVFNFLLVSTLSLTVVGTTYASTSNENPVGTKDNPIVLNPSSPYVQFPGTVITKPSVETQGLKKEALVFALRHGGKALDNLIDFLGVGTKEAKYISKYSDNIADYLDSVSNAAENGIREFLIFELGIPQGSARVIAYSIMLVVG